MGEMEVSKKFRVRFNRWEPRDPASRTNHMFGLTRLRGTTLNARLALLAVASSGPPSGKRRL